MYKYIKRLLDIILSLLLLILFFIPMLFITVCIKLDSKGPVLFKQKRTGYKGKEFILYKFRSMDACNDVLNFSVENKTTKFGDFMRKTSLDELPQFINILKGDMSFIGPRPWITEYARLFTEDQKRRLDVTPGVSGLAQVNGRNDISIINKIKYDLEYVDNFSFKMDMKIIFKTIKAIFTSQGSEINKKGIENELSQLKKNYLASNVMSVINNG